MFSKGFYYLWLYFGVHFVSFLVIILPPFVLLPFIKRKVSKQENETVEKNRKAAFITSLLVVLVYLLGFVAKVGGDFMFARFIIPVAPFIYFIIYYSILKLVNEKNLNKVFILLLILSVIETKVRFEFFKGYDDEGNQVIASNNDVADERDVYVNFTPIEIDTKLGKAIHRAFNGIDAKVLIGGGQACFGYYSNFSYCQEMYGLTDTVIAHSVIESRGRIGHEKQGTLEYFQKKGIHFMFNRDFPSMDTFQRAAFILPPFDLDLTIVSYDTDIMNKLKERFGSNILFTDFPVYLDYYILNKLPVTSPDNLKKDYDNFNLYYFSHNNDIKREDQFLKILGYQIKK